MKKHLSAVAAVLLAILAFFPAREPKLPPAELAALAARFRFQRVPLLETSNHPPDKSVRAVHPSLERISAWVSALGAAATLADLDGDGRPNDIISVDPRTDLVRVIPAPGTGDRYPAFALEMASWSQPNYDRAALAPMGAVAGDFNEDGRIDLLIYFWGRTPMVYLRKAAPAAELADAAPAGIVPVAQAPAKPHGPLTADAFLAQSLIGSDERWFSNAATQADFDGDGHIDLLIGNYFQDGSRVLDARAAGTEMMHEGKAKALNGGYKHLFLWQRGGSGPAPAVTFREVKDVFREEVARGWTVALGAADLDGDLLPEIYFAHDFGPDRLLHNRSRPGQLSFAELEGRRDFTTPKSCVLGHDSFKGMGCDFADVNGDGLLDIYVSNIATKFGLTESHFLWESTGRLDEMKRGIAPYVQKSESLGLSRSGFGWDARLADFDNDGDVEALQACGFIKGVINRWPELQALGTSNSRLVHNPRFWPSFRPGTDLSGHERNPFFVRARDGRYHDVASLLGPPEPAVTRGVAIGDVDADGRLDLVYANQWGPSSYCRNESPRIGAFLGLRLLRGSGSPAIGATATVTLTDGQKRVGHVDGGSGHSGRRSPEIHFGLGGAAADRALPVEIHWRDSAGTVRRTNLQLAPGWHDVRLSASAGLASRQP